MPVTKVVSSKRTVVSYTLEEFKKLLVLPEVLAVYSVNGAVEVVTASE